MHSKGPTIDFSEQTVYRNKEAIQYFEDKDSIDKHIDAIWPASSISVDFNNSVYEDGFYCLFAFPKGVL